MYTKAKGLLFQALSAVHAGSGSELGLVDLPIQREKHTSFPKIESSSLKGAIRSAVELATEKKTIVNSMFGPKNKDENEDAFASAVAFSDAKVLLFPVRSMKGVFAWVTCPFVLERFNQEMRVYEILEEEMPVPAPYSVAQHSSLCVNSSTVVLEEYTVKVKGSEDVKKLGDKLAELLEMPEFWGLSERLIVLSDDEFTDFVELSTEVNVRIRIDEAKGTVADTALFYEENVPPETIFYSSVFIGHSRAISQEKSYTATEIEQLLQDSNHFPDVFQLGGNMTLGRGMLKKVWIK